MPIIVSYVTKLSQLLGTIETVGLHTLSKKLAVSTNIELNTFITWNQVPSLASLKPNLLHHNHIGGENSVEVQSRFLH
jgi:hypothetical protein